MRTLIPNILNALSEQAVGDYRHTCCKEIFSVRFVGLGNVLKMPFLEIFIAITTYFVCFNPISRTLITIGFKLNGIETYKIGLNRDENFQGIFSTFP